ncbi:hypothetical protein FOCC_FOCC013983 [Frankliniella occidentalis]|nr:hypothetical protein FOCC_FOCC013983 [Frankliniella occidentalis]
MLVDCYPGTLRLENKAGYTTKEMFEPTIKFFIEQSKSTKENPTLLVVDNVGSHFTLETINMCKDNGVTLFTLPPDTTHKTQPLDVGISPFNKETFFEEEFVPGFVTQDQGQQQQQPSTSADHSSGEENQDEQIPEAEKGEELQNEEEVDDSDPISVPNRIIPVVDILGLPKAQTTQKPRRNSRKGKCMVATDTSEKNAIAATEAEIRRKKEEKEEGKRLREEKKAQQQKQKKPAAKKRNGKKLPQPKKTKKSKKNDSDSESEAGNFSDLIEESEDSSWIEEASEEEEEEALQESPA